MPQIHYRDNEKSSPRKKNVTIKTHFLMSLYAKSSLNDKEIENEIDAQNETEEIEDLLSDKMAICSACYF